MCHVIEICESFFFWCFGKDFCRSFVCLHRVCLCSFMNNFKFFQFYFRFQFTLIHSNIFRIPYIPSTLKQIFSISSDSGFSECICYFFLVGFLQIFTADTTTYKPGFFLCLSLYILKLKKY